MASSHVFWHVAPITRVTEKRTQQPRVPSPTLSDGSLWGPTRAGGGSPGCAPPPAGHRQAAWPQGLRGHVGLDRRQGAEAERARPAWERHGGVWAPGSGARCCPLGTGRGCSRDVQLRGWAGPGRGSWLLGLSPAPGAQAPLSSRTPTGPGASSLSPGAARTIPPSCPPAGMGGGGLHADTSHQRAPEWPSQLWD